MVSQEELNDTVERGQALFEDKIQALVAGEDPYSFLAIDVVSGDYEVAPDDITPCDRLHARHPDAVVFLRRVGDDAAYFIGGGGVL